MYIFLSTVIPLVLGSCIEGSSPVREIDAVGRIVYRHSYGKPKAGEKLALERMRMLNAYPNSLFGHGLDEYSHAFFPVGRADEAYIFEDSYSGTETGPIMIVGSSKNGKPKFTVHKLSWLDEAKRGGHKRFSLASHMQSRGVRLAGPASSRLRNALEEPRQLVDYHYDVMMLFLSVRVWAADNSGYHLQRFSCDEDASGRPMNVMKFFETYGLPTCDEESRLISLHQNGR